MGEARRKKLIAQDRGEPLAGGPTIVLARFGDGTFGAQIAAEDVWRMLADTDAIMRGKSRNQAKDLVIDVIRANGHLPTNPNAKAVAMSLLWLAAHSEARDLVREWIGQGGYTLAYDIIDLGVRDGLHGYNFRFLGAPSEVHPLAWILPPADAPTAGSA